ncbi:hypothetical protein EVAR_16887_1, partial [Eumeta japonica]
GGGSSTINSDAFKPESTGFILDRGRNDRWVFNLPQIKPRSPCLTSYASGPRSCHHIGDDGH